MSGKKFSWPKMPDSNSEFESLMRAIDDELAERKLEPWKRPLHIGRLLWEAFGWGGNIFPPKELAYQEGFSGEIIIAKANKWYEDVYGDHLKLEFAFGFAPLKVGNSIWRIRLGHFYGTVNFFIDKNLNNKGLKLSTPKDKSGAGCNILCEIEGLTQAYSDRLNDNDLVAIFNFYKLLIKCFTWRERLPANELFRISSADYEESTSSLLARNFEQSMWASQQSAEKLIKGILEKAGLNYEKGRKGHDLIFLAESLKSGVGINISKSLLDIANSSPNVRYGGASHTEASALQANHAVLGIMSQIIDHPGTSQVLGL
ncbi:HEPN domain-containing protein [Pseudomonas sp. PDM22]|uniref:HEPN domain-containing protein n=1 Tax=Pseudomonas sp. PDM22 TaxID=2769287 RepID=UPI0009D941A8|nr:HEPN domain-containing protein [Pseudomonas sp. PDM22]MBD9512747.1 HEPN domain-containing protein [Pseudomonas sp. PDM22]OQR29361.1 hypothetical protein BWR15_26665 [Pseudomonas sp. T]